MEIKDQLSGIPTHWNPWAKLFKAKMEWPGSRAATVTHVIDSTLKVQNI